MERNFTIRDAFLIAILLHIIPFFIDWATEGRFFSSLLKPQEIEKLAEKKEPLEFRFVDIPDDKEEPSESKIYSDKSRRAKTEKPSLKSPTEQPRIAGISPYEMTLPSPTEETLPSYQRESEEEEKIAQLFPKERLGETHQAPSKKEEEKFRENLDTFFKELGPPGYYNPDGSISTLGKPTFDTSEFDFGPYAKRLYWKVRSNWFPSPIMSYLGRSWESIIEFDILRDGTVENLRVIKESGIPSYDREALYAILASYPLEALPNGYKHERVGVRWHFYYHIYY